MFRCEAMKDASILAVFLPQGNRKRHFDQVTVTLRCTNNNVRSEVDTVNNYCVYLWFSTVRRKVDWSHVITIFHSTRLYSHVIHMIQVDRSFFDSFCTLCFSNALALHIIKYIERISLNLITYLYCNTLYCNVHMSYSVAISLDYIFLNNTYYS